MTDLVGWAFPLALLTPVVLIEASDRINRRRQAQTRARLKEEGIAPPAPIRLRR